MSSPSRSSTSTYLADRIRDALPDVQVRSMSQFNLQVGNIMGKLDLFLLLTVGLALLVGGVGIANTMLMSAMERIVDFGVMRANGWTRRNILGLVTAESSLLGLLRDWWPASWPSAESRFSITCSLASSSSSISPRVWWPRASSRPS